MIFGLASALPVTAAWRHPAPVLAVATAPGVVYLLESDRVDAREAATGRRLWSTPVPNPESSAGALAVVGDRLAVGVGEHILLLGRSTGRELCSVPVGLPVRRLLATSQGAIAVVSGSGGSAEARVLALDREGRIRGSHWAGESVYDLVEAQGLLVGIFGVSDEMPTVLVGLDPTHLTRQWERLFTVTGRFYRWRGALLVHRWTKERGRSFLPLDAASGRTGMPFPEREPSAGYSDLEWDLQVKAEPVALRLCGPAGHPVWESELPGVPEAWARDASGIFLAIGGEVLSLDPGTGRVVNAIGVVGEVQELSISDSLMLVRTDAELLAVSRS